MVWGEEGGEHGGEHGQNNWVFFKKGEELTVFGRWIFDEFLMNHRWEDDEFKALEDFCAANLFTYIVLAVSFFSKQVAIRLLKQDS